MKNKIDNKSIEVTCSKEVYGLIKYRFHGEEGDHFLEGQYNTYVAIPNKPYTKGKRIFKSIVNNTQLLALMYDCDTKEIVGFFESTGDVFEENTSTFTADKRAPGERWDLRIKGAQLINRDKAISAKAFKKRCPEINIVKGSVQGLTRERFETYKKYFSQAN